MEMLRFMDERSGEERLMYGYLNWRVGHVWEWQEVPSLGVLWMNSTNLGGQLMRVFQLLHHPGARTPVATQISYRPDKADALLEDALEEENLDDANLVDVEVKAEP
ncbi:hypothetical protein LR48_Vigan08g082100 [Vigna angularis]|uniref:Uncharacterized protein n=1 Tax=Phaseolus angularis TaxID=3914 RepID=A0A0L9V5R1_PHAAN|nr:hypothetical protein LR48_Vigan08g082100 [Vigna angularis]